MARGRTKLAEGSPWRDAVKKLRKIMSQSKYHGAIVKRLQSRQANRTLGLSARSAFHVPHKICSKALWAPCAPCDKTPRLERRRKAWIDRLVKKRSQKARYNATLEDHFAYHLTLRNQLVSNQPQLAAQGCVIHTYYTRNYNPYMLFSITSPQENGGNSTGRTITASLELHLEEAKAFAERILADINQYHS